MTELLSAISPLREAISEFYKLLKIAITFPVTTAKCERSFSVLKRIKNWLRTSKDDNRIGDLGVLAICAERALAINHDLIINEFKSNGNGGHRWIAL